MFSSAYFLTELFLYRVSQILNTASKVNISKQLSSEVSLVSYTRSLQLRGIPIKKILDVVIHSIRNSLYTNSSIWKIRNWNYELTCPIIAPINNYVNSKWICTRLYEGSIYVPKQVQVFEVLHNVSKTSLSVQAEHKLRKCEQPNIKR